MRKESALDDLQDVALFARVMEVRSFSRAARALGTTTSAVSKRVARLEGRLGVRLLVRTTRHVAPTEAGAAFYARTARILADVDEAEHAIASLGGAPRGTLRVSAPVILGERHVAPLLAGFLEKFPDVRIDLSLSDRFVDLVEEHFDVAVRVGPLGDSSLQRIRVGATSAITVASPAYLAKHGTPATPHELPSHNCMRYSLVTAAREWRFTGPEGEVSVPVVGNLEINHGAAIREAAISGLGIARLPRFLTDDALRSGALVSILDSYCGPPLGVHLVFPGGGEPLPKVRAFLDVIGAALRARLKAIESAA